MKTIFGSIDHDGSTLDPGSSNWACEHTEKGIYRIRINPGEISGSPIVVCSGTTSEKSPQDNTFTSFDVSPQGFSVKSYDVLGHAAGLQDAAFSFFAISPDSPNIHTTTKERLEAEPHPKLFVDDSELSSIAGRTRTDLATAWRKLETTVDSHMNKEGHHGTWRPSRFLSSDPLLFYQQCMETRDTVYEGSIGGQTARDVAVYCAIEERMGPSDSLTEKQAGLRELISAWAEHPLELDIDPEKKCKTLLYYSSFGMLISRGIAPLAYAYDLSHDLFDEGQHNTIKKFFRTAAYYIIHGIDRWNTFPYPAWVVNIDKDEPYNAPYFNHQYYQNHLAAHTMALAAIGIAIDDAELVNFAIVPGYEIPGSYTTPRGSLAIRKNPRPLPTLLERCIFSAGDEPCPREANKVGGPWPTHSGEIYDRYRAVTGKSGRGIQYSVLTSRMLTLAAEAAYHNGWNFFDDNEKALERTYSFLSDFYLTEDWRSLEDRKGMIYMKRKRQGGSVEEEENYFMKSDLSLGSETDGGTFLPDFFEVALKHFPNNERIERIPRREGPLLRKGRNEYRYTPILGPVVLTHGRDLH